MPVYAQAELLWFALFNANEMGDNAAAQAAGRRLAPLLAQIDDPQLLGVARLALAWISPIRGDYDGALRDALDSLELLRSHDEPYWAGVAGVTASGLEIATGHYEEARRHLLETRELADRCSYEWLAAWSRSQLATLDLASGQLGEARTLLNDSLTLGLTTHDSRNVSLILIEFARLALAGRDPERAARLTAAAEGLRERTGLQPWPMLRPREEELRTQIREALGPERFADAFAAGAHLSQREAIAVARELDHADARR
jgi:ATP/maltotriose-dependent transcriptional regulator MalT